MLRISFRLGGEIIEVVSKGNNIFFSDPATNMLTTIEGLRLSKAGVIKEFPDLKNKKNWKEEAIKRFKNHIKSLDKEEDVSDYIVKELKKYGYEPLLKQKAGFRPKRL